MAPREVYRDNLVNLDPGVKVPDVDDLLFEETTEYSDYHDKETITLDDAIDEVRLIIETAVDFIQDDMEPEWAKAEEYYAGGSDLPLVVGRSAVSSTDVRDAVRAW